MSQKLFLYFFPILSFESGNSLQVQMPSHIKYSCRLRVSNPLVAHSEQNCFYGRTFEHSAKGRLTNVLIRLDFCGAASTHTFVTYSNLVFKCSSNPSRRNNGTSCN